MRTILAIGRDPHLLDTRARLLGLLQVDVVTTSGKEAARALMTRQFDLVVLCHTLTMPEMVEIASRARQQNPAVRILQLLLTEFETSGLNEVDDAVGTAKPDKLVAKVSKMLVH